MIAVVEIRSGNGFGYIEFWGLVTRLGLIHEMGVDVIILDETL